MCYKHLRNVYLYIYAPYIWYLIYTIIVKVIIIGINEFIFNFNATFLEKNIGAQCITGWFFKLEIFATVYSISVT